MKALKFFWKLAGILFMRAFEIAVIVMASVGVVVTSFYIMHLINPEKF